MANAVAVGCRLKADALLNKKRKLPSTAKGHNIASLIGTEARVDRGRMSKDGSANTPHRISCADGNDYAVKPTGTDRQFANELLAIALGTVANVPMFDAAIVTITPTLLQASPSLAARYAAGTHFGSKVPTKNCFDFRNVSPALVRSNIRNAGDFYTLAVFDELIANTDRAGNRGNLIAVEAFATSPHLEFVAIDHGHAFTGPSWARDALEHHVPAPVYPVLDVVREIVTSKATLLENATQLAAKLPSFNGAVAAARAGIDDMERLAVLNLLTTRSAQLAAWVSSPGYTAHLPFLA